MGRKSRSRQSGESEDRQEIEGAEKHREDQDIHTGAGEEKRRIKREGDIGGDGE